MDDRTLVGGIVALIAGFAGLVWLDAMNDTLRDDLVPQTIVWFLVAFGGYVVVCLRSQATQPVNLTALLLLGLGLRLVLLVTEPTLSDDVYRYLWEGHLVTEGVSPYSFAIDSALGDAYTIPTRALVNNQTLASPYLPVAHGIFGAVAFVLPAEPWTMQLVMIAFDTLAAAMIIKLLGLVGLPPRRVLLYWLNPLVIVEIAHGAHIDALIVGLGLAGIWLTFNACGERAAHATTATILAGPALVAAATLTRPLALLLIPVLFWLWSWRQRAMWFVALTVPIALAAGSTGLGLDQTGTGVFGSARAYTTTFRFNSGIYHWLETWIAGRGLDDNGWNEPMALTRLIIALVVVVALFGVFVAGRRRRSERHALRLMALPLMIYVAFTPVLHPWYVLTLLAFTPFLAPGVDEPTRRWVAPAPWLLLSALLIFSYLTYEEPTAFGERTWVRRLEWYPTLAVMGVWLVASRSYRGSSAQPHDRETIDT